MEKNSLTKKEIRTQIMNNGHPKIVDCTIRDGGHLNDWNFSPECVRDSYYAAVNAGVDYFEIGYRFANPKAGFGKFASCEDDYLFSLFDVSPKCKISIMIDAGKSTIKDFKSCYPELTPISLVRVATYPEKLDIAFELCEGLKAKGYEVFLNLMAISRFQTEHFNKLRSWKNKKVLDAIYFADSFGAFIPSDVITYQKKLRKLGFSNISFHAHNNLQLGLANTIKAIENNFYAIDASIYGMGRGAGNLPIEILIGYLNKIGYVQYNSLEYIKIIEKYYLEHQKLTPWGYKIEGLIGGLKNIHPYYVTGLYDKHDWTTEEIWKKADQLKKKAPISFDIDSMNKILFDKNITSQ